MSNPACAAAMRSAMRQPCALCGDDPYVACVFTPSDPKRFGTPAGKVRLVVYSLCRDCFGKPDKAERVEQALLADLAGGGAGPRT